MFQPSRPSKLLKICLLCKRGRLQFFQNSTLFNNFVLFDTRQFPVTVFQHRLKHNKALTSTLIFQLETDGGTWYQKETQTMRVFFLRYISEVHFEETIE